MARLQLQSNASGVGRLSLRVPDVAAVAALSVDGNPVAFDLDEFCDDRFVRLSTTWASHVFDLQLR